MKINFIIPGKCKEEYLNTGINEYIKRISKYAKVNLIYINEEKNDGTLPSINKALKLEAEHVLKLVKDDVLFLIDIHGKEYSSDEIASLINKETSINGNISFVFGSSYGLDDSLREKAKYKISLSKMTFTHYMALFLMTEQVYRSLKINAGEIYNK